LPVAACAGRPEIIAPTKVNMPPKKLLAKGKGKAKGKGRGKGKSKAAKAKAKARAAAARAAARYADPDAVNAGGDEEMQDGETALMVAKRQGASKVAGLRKKVMEEIGEKTIDEVMEEQRKIIERCQEIIAQGGESEQARSAKLQGLEAEHEKARAEVEALMTAEQDAAVAFRQSKEKKIFAASRIETARKNVLEVQKKAAMMEVMAVNNRKMKELEEKRKLATAAAEAAKKNLAEQRQREKDALEATRKALDEARQKAKERKNMRGALGSPAKKKAALMPELSARQHDSSLCEEETIPASMADGEDIE